MITHISQHEISWDKTLDTTFSFPFDTCSSYEIKSQTTTKPYPTKWGRLHGSDDAIVFYHKPLCHRDSTKFYVGCQIKSKTIGIKLHLSKFLTKTQNSLILD